MLVFDFCSQPGHCRRGSSGPCQMKMSRFVYYIHAKLSPRLREFPRGYSNTYIFGKTLGELTTKQAQSMSSFIQRAFWYRARYGHSEPLHTNCVLKYSWNEYSRKQNTAKFHHVNANQKCILCRWPQERHGLPCHTHRILTSNWTLKAALLGRE